jgi:hypothetical protein
LLPELTGEDFESGDFASWPWVFDGSQPWTIDTVVKHEGLYSARSGVIGNNASTTMLITLPVAVAGNISFCTTFPPKRASMHCASTSTTS